MIVIRVRNVNFALPAGLSLLKDRGFVEESRNGDVLRAPEPVCTIYERPTERVLFCPRRDANPFFHFYESLWMLGGRNDLAPLKKYVKQMAEYSDDGVTFNAAYGERWRRWGSTGHQWSRGMDQIVRIIHNLRENPLCRRQVLQIWDPERDLVAQKHKKDVACNLTVMFQRPPRTNELDMILTCRSNDMIWGAYGANAVHFSMLLEYVAHFAKLNVGKMYQISANFHAYRKVFDPLIETGIPPVQDIYQTDHIRGTFPIAKTYDEAKWDSQNRFFLTEGGTMTNLWRSGAVEFDEPFFEHVAAPIVLAHDIYKSSHDAHRFERAMSQLEYCRADDWRIACKNWIQRRWNRFEKEADDGPTYE